MAARFQRLDVLLVRRGLAQSRQRALALVLAGRVLVDGRKITKAGARVREEADLRLCGGDIPYVSRGGLKLEAALKAFELDVSGWRCLDVGVSTGGFTDCLLQHGAAHVTAVDVGYGQVHWNLRNDPRVTLLERTNIRHFSPDTLASLVDLACIDVSFISLKIVVPVVMGCIKPTGRIVSLIKPQFEVGKGSVGKGGVVRDESMHKAVIDNLTEAFFLQGLRRQALIPSPIVGAKGNREFLALLTPVDGAVTI